LHVPGIFMFTSIYRKATKSVCDDIMAERERKRGEKTSCPQGKG